MSEEVPTGIQGELYWRLENLTNDTAHAVRLLREALQSEDLTPYVERRIRSAIMVLGENP